MRRLLRKFGSGDNGPDMVQENRTLRDLHRSVSFAEIRARPIETGVKGLAGVVDRIGRARSDYLWSGYASYRTVANPLKEGTLDRVRQDWRRDLVKGGATCFWHAVATVLPTNTRWWDREFPKLGVRLRDGVSETEAVEYLNASELALYVHNPLTSQVDVILAGQKKKKERACRGVMLVYTDDAGQCKPHWLPVFSIQEDMRHEIGLAGMKSIVKAWEVGNLIADAQWIKMVRESIVEEEQPTNAALFEMAFQDSAILSKSVEVTRGLLQVVPKRYAPSICDLLARSAFQALEAEEREYLEQNWAVVWAGLQMEQQIERETCYELPCETARVLFREFQDGAGLIEVEWMKIHLLYESFCRVGAMMGGREHYDAYGFEVPPIPGRGHWYRHNTVGATQVAVKQMGFGPAMWRRVMWFLTLKSHRTMIETRPEIVMGGVPIRPGSLVYSTDVSCPRVQVSRDSGGVIEVKRVRQITTNRGSTYEVQAIVDRKVSHYGELRTHQIGVLRLIDAPWWNRLLLRLPCWFERTTTMSLVPQDSPLTREALAAVTDREMRVRALCAMVRPALEERSIGIVNEFRNSLLSSEDGDVEQFVSGLGQLMDAGRVITRCRPDQVLAFAYA